MVKSINKFENKFVLEDAIKLSAEQIDSLMELGNIGSGNAVTALSDLLNVTIEMSLTYVSIIPFWKITDLLENLEMEVFGICSDVIGDANLSIFQYFSKESVINMVNNLSQKVRKEATKDATKIKEIGDIDEFSLSIISEIGNILAGHYTSALADLMSTTLIPEVPEVALDTLGTIINSLVAKFSKTLNHLILINTKVRLEELSLSGNFCFIPDVKTLERIFKAINVDYKFAFQD